MSALELCEVKGTALAVEYPAWRTLIEVRNLHVRFGPEATPVIRGISFNIHRGECVAFIGESGSGKSVTSRTLVGLAGPTAQVKADHFSYDGEDLRRADERRWRSLRGGKIGFVMQDALASLDPLRPVGAEIEESLRLHTRLTRRERALKAVEVLASVGVPEPSLRARQLPHQLSGGLRQRALIASAIACGPEVLIADEPTTALDAVIQAQVLELLASLRTPEKALILISHDFAVISRLADTVAVMHRGVIVEHGPIESVLSNPQHAYTQSLLEAARDVHRRGGLSPRAVPAPSVSSKVNGSKAPFLSQGKPAVVEARGLAKTFIGPDNRCTTAVDDVSFALAHGETLGLVGESGSGKTTILRLILGLEAPDAGSCLLNGRDWRVLAEAERRSERRRMQVVFQNPLASFDPRHTVARVLDEALGVAPGLNDATGRRKRAAELLDMVRLDESFLPRRPIELSGGQCQRLAIARALAPGPDVLICDEPVSAVDVSVQVQILDLLNELKRRLGLACIIISHDLGVIHRVSDRVLVLKDGAVVESGLVREIFSRPEHPYTRALLSAIPQIDFKANAIYI